MEPLREDEQEFGQPLAASDSAAITDDAIADYSQIEAEALEAERRGEGHGYITIIQSAPSSRPPSEAPEKVPRQGTQTLC